MSSVFAKFAKWKMRWAVVSGIFTLIIWPLVKLILAPRKSKQTKTTKTGKTSDQIIDVEAHEVPRDDKNQSA